MKKHAMRWFHLVVIAASFLVSAGCGSQDSNVTMTSANATGIVTGRVVDSSTMNPVKNADVTLIANGSKLTAKSSASDDPDLAGTFVFSGVSAAPNGGHTLRITAPGYASTQKNILLPVTSDNAPVTTSLGRIALGKGFDLTVIASDKGTPVAGVTINASENWWNELVVSAVTDANGQAILKGLNQESEYVITSAPFYDGNGNLKYKSSPIASNTFNAGSDRVVAIPLASAVRDDSIQIVASNLLPDGTMNQFNFPSLPNQRVTTPDGVIRIVFNYPVTLSGPVTATFVNNQAASSDPNFGNVITVSTIAASLDQTGTILTITNSAPYLANQTYTFLGTVTAMVNSLNQSFSLNGVPSSNSQFFSDNIYIADNTPAGLTLLTTLKADNFNGTTGATATTIPGSVSVEFPEKVYGTYSVISTRNGGTTTAANGAAVTFGFVDGSAVFAKNANGADSSVVFRLPINAVSLPDNSATNPSEVTIYFNVIDAEGNKFSKTVTLPVQ